MHRIKLEIFSGPLDTDNRFSILLFRKIIHLHRVGIVTQIDSTFTSTFLHHTLHSHLHKVLRHFLMTETDGNLNLIGKCGNVLKNSAPISNFLVGECSWGDARYELKAMSAIPGTHATHLRFGSYHFRISGLKGL